ncbi:MAG: hypothetical protein ABIH03_01085, partial [Pseudomonadota bacterium]
MAEDSDPRFAGLAAAIGPAALGVAGFLKLWALGAGIRAMFAAPMAIAAIKTSLLSLGAVLTPTGAVLVGLGLLAAAFVHADNVARKAAESWRAALSDAKASIAGLAVEAVEAQAVGALRQLAARERLLADARAELATITARYEAQRAEAAPSQLGKLRQQYIVAAAPVEERIRSLSGLLLEMRARVEVLSPEFARLAAEQVAMASAAAAAARGTEDGAAALAKYEDAVTTAQAQLAALQALQNEIAPRTQPWMVLERTIATLRAGIEEAAGAFREAQADADKAAAGYGRTVTLTSMKLGELYDELKKKLESARKELYALEVSQGAIAQGTQAWTDLGESISGARTEIAMVESALARVREELNRIAQAKLGALDFRPRALGNLMLGLQVPNLRDALGLPRVPTVPGKTEGGQFVPTAPTPSAALQVAELLAAQRKQTEAGAFGMTPEQFTALQRAARAAGLSVEQYADALGIVREAQTDVTAIAISGMGAVVAAFAGGMQQIEVTVVSAITQILQTLSQQGKLGGFLG